MRSFSVLFVGVALAEESCSDGTCAQDEATLLQVHGLRQKFQREKKQSPDSGMWPQFEVDKSKCNNNVDVQYVGSQEACQAVAVAAGHDFYSYRHNVDSTGENKCFSSAHCDDGLIADRTNDWNAYRANPGSLWAQYEVDKSKCNLNIGVEFVGSQADCQALAEANGHEFYSYRHNNKDGEYKCFSSADCGTDLIGDRTNDWRIYRARPFATVATGMKCPHQHGDRLFREPDSGSGSNTHSDCYDQCLATDGCNHFSYGPWEEGYVCMGCTSLTNAQEHEPFTTYDMPGLTRYTLDGCGSDGSDTFPLTGYGDPDATSDVRCCSTDGGTGVSQGFAGGEDYFRPGASAPHSTGCMFGKTFLEARAICAAAEMRLCAPHEIESTCNSGCWHNHAAVWVDTPTVGVTIDGCSTDNSNSNPSGYPGSDDSGALIPSAQKTIDETAAVRCCSYNGGSCASTVAGVCNDAVTFVEAQRLCSEDQQRLCSTAEMDACCGTGCWYNHFSTWTSSGL